MLKPPILLMTMFIGPTLLQPVSMTRDSGLSPLNGFYPSAHSVLESMVMHSSPKHYLSELLVGKGWSSRLPTKTQYQLTKLGVIIHIKSRASLI
ncbi:unnamed protein product [Linum trigynum]|uniref:Uncharacterized protein n=1 Tax=Linum trigynum TaxID=586398 RepID=A0AAV2EWY4_9ROSI